MCIRDRAIPGTRCPRLLSRFFFGHRAPGIAIGDWEPAIAVAAPALRLGDLLNGPRDRARRWRMQEESLHEMHTELLHRLVLLRALDSLGDYFRVLIVCKTHHRLYEILLDEVRVDAVD